MDLLGGEDMSRLRNRARAASGVGLVTLPAAVYLAREMLSCVRGMHGKGYLHRDVKPANFVRREKEGTKFSMVDFGLARQVRYS
jgi:serine/threonine protein kinase